MSKGGINVAIPNPQYLENRLLDGSLWVILSVYLSRSKPTRGQDLHGTGMPLEEMCSLKL